MKQQQLALVFGACCLACLPSSLSVFILLAHFGSFRNWTRQIGYALFYQFAILTLSLLSPSFHMPVQFCSSSANCAAKVSVCVSMCSKYKERLASYREKRKNSFSVAVHPFFSRWHVHSTHAAFAVAVFSHFPSPFKQICCVICELEHCCFSSRAVIV